MKKIMLVLLSLVPFVSAEEIRSRIYAKADGLDVKIYGSEWIRKLTVEDGTSDVPWLAVTVSFDNNSKNPISLPRLQLEDSKGATYDKDPNTCFMYNGLPSFVRLNPNEGGMFRIAFRVPTYEFFYLKFIRNGNTYMVFLRHPTH